MVGLALMMIGVCASLYPFLPWVSLSLGGLLLYSLAGGTGLALQPNTSSLLVILGLSLIPGSIFSTDYGASAKGLYDLTRGVMAGLTLGLILMTPLRQRYFLALLLVTLLLALIQHLPLMDGALRNSATYQLELSLFAHPARLAATITMWLLLIWLAPHSDTHRRIYLPIASIIILALTLVASARGPVVALIATVLLYTSWRARSWPTRILRMALSLACLPIALILTGQLLDRGVEDSGRYSLWQHTLSVYASSPWVGMGNNTFKGVPNEFLQGSQLQMPHNIYLELLFSGGPLALTLMLTAFFIWLYRGTKQQHEHLASFIPMIFVLTLGMVDTKLFSTTFGLYFGMALAMTNYKKQKFTHTQRGYHAHN
jgi:O-antigen ligase